jgi:chromosome segregation ATPase
VEVAKVSELTLERDDLLAARSELQTAMSHLQENAQLANEKEGALQATIADLQAQLHAQKEAFQEQSAALALAVEGAHISRDSLQSAFLAASTILEQLQMTNESSRDYGSTLLEVSCLCAHPDSRMSHFLSFWNTPATCRY